VPLKPIARKKEKLNEQLSSSEYGEEVLTEDSEVLEYEAEFPKIKYKLISIGASDYAPDK
jgi:hypothetical protein